MILLLNRGNEILKDKSLHNPLTTKSTEALLHEDTSTYHPLVSSSAALDKSYYV